ncbi:MAG: hypothetical protein F7B11_03210 [Caldisphaeraceae archaeon]|nr:hypothetical protein [Caldisphaeraceae archaeon]
MEECIDKDKLKKLRKVIDVYYLTTNPLLKDFTERSLNSMRWDGIGLLMVLDAAFTSVGLNYFNIVVPAIIKFKESFYDTGKIRSFNQLLSYNKESLRRVWKNSRSWNVAFGIAKTLHKYPGNDDRERLRSWARSSSLEGFRDDEIGKVKGVGLVTYQYLRIMGGVDTIMPDKIVMRFIEKVIDEVGIKVHYRNIMDEIKKLEHLFKMIGVRPVEITWMSWLVDSELRKILSGVHKEILSIL